MGMKGPKPTPGAILRARGSWRAGLAKREPKPRKQLPSCPKWISIEAKRAWRRLVGVLDYMGVLTEADRDVLERYCVTWARWKAVEEKMQELGMNGQVLPVTKTTIRKGPGGEPIEETKVVGLEMTPFVRIADMLASQLNRMEQGLGLSPSARTRISVDAKEETRGAEDRRKRELLGVGA